MWTLTSVRHDLDGALCEVWTAYPCQTRLEWCLIRGVNCLPLSDTTWLFWCLIRGVNCLPLSDTTWMVSYKRYELLTSVRHDLTTWLVSGELLLIRMVSYKRCAYPCQTRLDYWCLIRGVNCLPLSDTTWMVSYKRCELLTPVRHDLTILVSYKRCELLTPVRFWCLIRGVNCLPLSDLYEVWRLDWWRGVNCLPLSDTLDWCLIRGVNCLPLSDTTCVLWCLIRGVNCLPLSDTTWLVSPIRGVNCLPLSDTTWLACLIRGVNCLPLSDTTWMVSYKRCELL